MVFRKRLALVLAPFCLAIVVHAACVSPELQKVLQNGSTIIEAGQKCLLEAYEAEQKLCLTEAGPKKCVEDVREDWKKLIETIEEYHKLRCELEPAKCKDLAADLSKLHAKRRLSCPKSSSDASIF